MEKLTRREFIKITAAAGGLALGGSLLKQALFPKVTRIEETRLLMGTIINLTLITDDAVLGRQAVNKTFSELERLVGIFDHRNPQGVLGKLNAAGKLHHPPKELVYVIEQAIQVSDLTHGAFDITIKPLVDLYQKAKNQGFGIPNEDQIKFAAALVDYSQISLANDLIQFLKSGMQITLDGIAKGYIVDQGVKTLKSTGFDNVIVEAGGDLFAAGSKENQTPWKIGVQSPRNKTAEMLRTAELSNQAVATSGDYMNAFTADLSKHHIIDPRTGTSSPELASATVVGLSAIQADALATSLMVLGVSDGLALVESLTGFEAFIITKNMETYQSSGF